VKYGLIGHLKELRQLNVNNTDRQLRLSLDAAKVDVGQDNSLARLDRAVSELSQTLGQVRDTGARTHVVCHVVRHVMLHLTTLCHVVCYVRLHSTTPYFLYVLSYVITSRDKPRYKVTNHVTNHVIRALVVKDRWCCW
jgi:hypothetical protein